MTNLPEHKTLSISKLSRVFKNTSATYKYYWFLAIIESVEDNQTIIKKEKLFVKMLSIPWYTVNFFHVSFGNQDLIQQTIGQIIQLTGLSISEKKSVIENRLLNTGDNTIKRLINHFDKNVPHWFLSPWYEKNKKHIYSHSKDFKDLPIYALHQDEIHIQPDWFNYIQKHSKLLKDFCFWNLSLFLQVRNPNVPDIPNKLIRPAKRNSLTKQRNEYWSKYITMKGNVTCIFTGRELTTENYALDHFIPFAFVSHDLLWNLIPIDSNFNSVKSNKLPSLEHHFDLFYGMQKDAYSKLSQAGLLKKGFKEDYYSIFPNLKTEEDFNKEKFKNIIAPLINIAENNGFERL